MKINIEIADDNKLVEALVTEISRSKNAKLLSEAASGDGEKTYELTRPETLKLTCVAVSCGT